MLHVESPVSGASGHSWRLSEKSRKHEVCTPHCFNLHDSNYCELAVKNIIVRVPTTGLVVFFLKKLMRYGPCPLREKGKNDRGMSTDPKKKKML